MESTVDRVWSRLKEVSELEFLSSSESINKTGWIGKGQGKVVVEHVDDSCLIFEESGSWNNEQGHSFDFSNRYRWRLTEDGIKLEHLRFGNEKPVYLFELVEVDKKTMSSACPHVCSEDLYTATLVLADEIKLDWSVVGPEMKENIKYRYKTN